MQAFKQYAPGFKPRTPGWTPGSSLAGRTEQHGRSLPHTLQCAEVISRNLEYVAGAMVKIAILTVKTIVRSLCRQIVRIKLKG